MDVAREALATRARILFILPILITAATGVAAADGQAGDTSLLVESQAGEPIGGGASEFFSSQDGDFQVPPFGAATNQEIQLEFVGTPYLVDTGTQGVFWSLWFAAPPGQTLAAGVYANAVSPEQRAAGQPGLQVSGNSRACIDTTGQFEIRQIEFDAYGSLTRFWATFQQTCGAVLSGEVRLNADVPVVLQAPTHRTAQEGRPLAYDVRGTDGSGSPAALVMTGMPAGASFSDAGDGTGHFAWTPAAGQAGATALVSLQGTVAGGATDAIDTLIETIPDFDDFDHAIPFATLPYQSIVYRPAATRVDDDPICPTPGPGPYPMPSPDPDLGTVWYAFTPSESGGVEITVEPGYFPGPIPDLPAGLAVFTGTRGALDPVACTPWPAQRFQASAGETYYVKVDASPLSRIRVSAAALPPPPANDLFSDATVVAALPYSEVADTRGAMVQLDEPGSCGSSPPDIGNGFPKQPTNVWYAYTPSVDTRVTVDTSGSDYDAVITPFSGNAGGLQALPCNNAHASFTALAGRTYHIMVAASGNPRGGRLALQITGKPAFSMQVALDHAGSIDALTGQGVVQGTLTCSRPARVVIQGTLEERRRARGWFAAVVSCAAGVNPWSAPVALFVLRNRPEALAPGIVDVGFTARGVPNDNSDDEADATGGDKVSLKRPTPH